MTGHAIEGIGDKHVTWIYNVLNMDWLICIDDQQCLEGLQLLQEGTKFHRQRWHNQKYYTWVE